MTRTANASAFRSSLAYALLLVAALGVTGRASAQESAREGEALHMQEPVQEAPDRPTSGDLSLFSGRTISKGETTLAAGVAWPSIWAGIWLAPSSTLSIGIQGHVYYGSPLMGFAPGAGFGLTAPMRLHLWGAGKLDFSLTAEPAVVLGEGRLVGQNGIYQDSFGYGIYGLIGAVGGAQVSDTFTISLGASGLVGYVHTPSRNVSPVSAVGGILGTLGVEAAMSRDTLLFLHLRGGVGFSDGLFESQAILNAWLGLAYLL